MKLQQHLQESLAKPAELTRARQALAHPQNVHSLLPSGMRELGYGAAARVFSVPDKDYVLKIFYQSDYGYKSWLKFCEANQRNSFVPKLRGKATPINNKVAYVRLEKLRNPSREEIGMFNTMLELWRSYKMYALAKKNPATFRMQAKEYKEFRLSNGQKWEELIKCMSYIEMHGFTDIRETNFLCRPNGQIVITDPLYYENDHSIDQYIFNHQVRYTPAADKMVGNLNTYLKSRYNPGSAEPKPKSDKRFSDWFK